MARAARFIATESVLVRPSFCQAVPLHERLSPELLPPGHRGYNGGVICASRRSTRERAIRGRPRSSEVGACGKTLRALKPMGKWMN